jgi:hypothetical protein
MIKGLKILVVSILCAVFLSGAILQPSVHAAPAVGGSACPDRVFGFPTWYRGLTKGDCSIKQPASNSKGLSNFIWTIVLNIVEIGLVLAAYVAAGYIVYGGFLYITGAGEAQKITGAKNSILHAVIGLVIAMASIGIVNLIVSSVT